MEWVVVALTYFVVGILAFDQLGIPLTTLVAPATVIGIGLGFGAQQMVGDLLAGFFLFAEHQFAFGDVIRLSMPGQTTGITGTVEELTLAGDQAADRSRASWWWCPTVRCARSPTCPRTGRGRSSTSRSR